MVLVIPESTFRGLPARPGRSVKHGNKEEENKEIKEMVGARTYYFRGCKRIRWSISLCIPDEMLFEILVRLPAEDVYFGARLVCRKWYHMTHTKIFIQKHLERPSYGLLYMNNFGESVLISARDDGKGINTYTLSYKPQSSIMPVWRSCNGLMLEFYFLNGIIYYVTNALTGHTFRLPPSPNTFFNAVNNAIGYDASSMAYKVVTHYRNSEWYGYAIFTLGVDKSWRSVDTNHNKRALENVSNEPIMTEGFIHWHLIGTTKVVTLNLETEIVAQTSAPVVLKGKTQAWCVSAGRCLSLFIRRKKLVWEVFEMNPKTGEWRKLPNICLEGQMAKIKRLGFKFKHDDVDIKPCGWVKYPDVLALNVRCGFIIFYNFITCEVGAEKLPVSCSHYITLHKNSLVWSGGF